MRIVFLVLSTILLIAACQPAEEATGVERTDIEMTFAVEPDPPNVGDSNLIITLMTADGEPVEGAIISAQGDMDHEGMEPINGEGSEDGAGVYRIPFQWTMGGGWIVDVTATLKDSNDTVTDTFTLDVGAISSDSIINQESDSGNDDTDDSEDSETDHSDMDMDSEDGETDHSDMDMEATEEASE